jgi:hypothetical protein
MNGNSNRPKGVVMRGLLYFAGMDGNLVLFPHQIDLGEKATTRELVGIIVQHTIVSTGTPTVVLLGQIYRPEDQKHPERRAVPSRNMASNSALAIVSQSSANRRDRKVTWWA